MMMTMLVLSPSPEERIVPMMMRLFVGGVSARVVDSDDKDDSELRLSFRRVRVKYESELKELEASEQNMKQKYNTMKVGCP